MSAGCSCLLPLPGKWWRFRFRFDGKEKLLSLGVYPDVGLKDARNRRDEARKLLAEGTDPGEDRKTQKTAKQDRAANSFEAVAREWFEKFSPKWVEHTGGASSADSSATFSPGWRQTIADVTARNCWPWSGGLKAGARSKPHTGARRLQSGIPLRGSNRALCA